MVDAVKLLGALLGGGNMSSGSGASILKSVLGSALGGGGSQAIPTWLPISMPAGDVDQGPA